MNPMTGETRNPFSNAKVVAVGLDEQVYLRQEKGVYPGNPAYVQSRSELMRIRSCPAKWRAGWPNKESDSTDFGSLIDCRILLPNLFGNKYAVTPKTCIATKSMKCVKDGEAEAGDSIAWNPLCAEAKAWNEKMEAQGLRVLSLSEKDESDAAVRRLLADRRIDDVLSCSKFQCMVIGEYCDSATGLVVSVKSLIDIVPDKHSLHSCELGDLKTTHNASPGAWRASVDKLNYDAQAAMCLDLYNAATGEQRDTFIHVVLENTPPYQTARRMLSQDFVELGRLKVVDALKIYCQCLKTQFWPDWDSESEYNGWGLVQPDSRMMERFCREGVTPRRQQDEPQPEPELSEVIP